MSTMTEKAKQKAANALDTTVMSAQQAGRTAMDRVDAAAPSAKEADVQAQRTAEAITGREPGEPKGLVGGTVDAIGGATIAVRDKVGEIIGGTLNTVGNVVHATQCKTGEVVHGTLDFVGGTTMKAIDLAGSATGAVIGTADNVVRGTVDMVGNTTHAAIDTAGKVFNTITGKNQTGQNIGSKVEQMAHSPTKTAAPKK